MVTSQTSISRMRSQLKTALYEQNYKTSETLQAVNMVHFIGKMPMSLKISLSVYNSLSTDNKILNKI